MQGGGMLLKKQLQNRCLERLKIGDRTGILNIGTTLHTSLTPLFQPPILHLVSPHSRSSQAFVFTGECCFVWHGESWAGLCISEKFPSHDGVADLHIPPGGKDLNVSKWVSELTGSNCYRYPSSSFLSFWLLLHQSFIKHCLSFHIWFVCILSSPNIPR